MPSVGDGEASSSEVVGDSRWRSSSAFVDSDESSSEVYELEKLMLKLY